ncbi:MAG: hypothetical protein EU543_01405 [Promethearchaeota archaeon]|nr:MAG: hypothetical protein EU543_01405 [Candidatus Lokiarchaeota archaeon]
MKIDILVIKYLANSMEENNLSNKQIAERFKDYMKLTYKPLGMYFSNTMPEGKIRTQGKILGRCIVGHVFKASKNGGTSIIKEGTGCPGGQFWSGFRKKVPDGWAHFMTHGRDDVLGGRAEHFKKDIRVAVKTIKDPGPVKKTNKFEYVVFQALKEVPETQTLEFILFFVNPNTMAKLITLLNYGRHVPYAVKAAAGSGCMSLLNHPLKMKKKPEVDAIMGIWDPFARRTVPKDLLSLTLRRWIVEEMAFNIPQSFLAYTAPFTPKGETKRFFKKKLLRK